MASAPDQQHYLYPDIMAIEAFIHSLPPEFQGEMRRILATVYAIAQGVQREDFFPVSGDLPISEQIRRTLMLRKRLMKLFGEW